jgi:ABC-type multidrug transport system fused ATPase/permease subunit
MALVRRTGAGKSSLISALFRLLEVDGSVILSGVDNKRVPLRDLRSDCLSIISQDPFLFAGSVRSNVDPFSRFSDEDVAAALKSVTSFRCLHVSSPQIPSACLDSLRFK